MVASLISGLSLNALETVDIDKVVEATHVISPILDENEVIKEQYVLDVSSKERGN